MFNRQTDAEYILDRGYTFNSHQAIANGRVVEGYEIDLFAPNGVDYVGTFYGRTYDRAVKAAAEYLRRVAPSA